MSADGAMVSAIVLAGGRAQRFGGDKLRAPLRDGRSILAHAVAATGDVADDVVVVLSPDGDEPGGLAAGVRFVRDPERFGGPIVGLRAGLDVVRGDRVVIVGGDMPSLVPGVLRRLLETLDGEDAAHIRPEAAILEAAPGNEGSLGKAGVGKAGPGKAGPWKEAGPVQTLPSAVRRDAARLAVNAALDAGDRRLQGLFERLRVARIPAAAWMSIDPYGRTLTDVDRPADLPTDPPGT
jgi:molybdopterin-guanine dinucleotide biosynthesis protein A